MIRVLCALLALTLAAPLALADCRRRVAVVQVVPIVALPYVPTYAASYDPGYDRLALAVERIADSLGPQLAAKAPDLALQTLHNRCVQCHTESVAESKGKGVALLKDDGSLLPLTTLEKRAVRHAVASGTMPPKSPLSDAEKKMVEGLK